MSEVFSAERSRRCAEEAIAYRERYWSKRTMLDSGIVVDTCRVLDTEKYETAVKRELWIAVEEYESEEEAKAGHDEWVKQLTYRPDMPLNSVHF